MILIQKIKYCEINDSWSGMTLITNYMYNRNLGFPYFQRKRRIIFEEEKIYKYFKRFEWY